MARAVAAAALGLGGLAGCTASAPSTVPATRGPGLGSRTVLVIGDSNLVLAATAVEAALHAAGIHPVLDARPGFGLKDETALYAGLVPELVDQHRPAVVVVALGANDAVVPADAAAFGTRLDALLRAIGDRSVVWVTHTTDRPEPAGTGARAVNTAVRIAALRWPNLRILDFAAVLESTPGLIGPDRLHLTEQGSAALAAALTRVVDQVLAGRPAG